ncbi:hypothetical protein Anas_05627 [Armadillidium nasatum]|uniref:Myb/SANT-like DNA-binding domain-containing protein n=1 Tax=Armadillidium nasatum TaxID=96803 RepID=A0A5N5SPE5_9CRUS|nr:hypothetical protein Anas_05627 [Armadillidium nasatum]
MTQKVPLVGDGILLQVCINPEAVMLEDTEIHKGKFKENENLPVNQLESVSEDSSKGWSHEMICLLLASMSANYQNYCNQLTRDMAYKAIIEVFKNHGYELNKNPIKKKWNSLLTTYRRTRDRLKSNGESKQTWVYYDHIDEIVQKSAKETSPPPIANVESFHFEESDLRNDEQTHKSSFDIEPIEIKSEIQELEEDNEDKGIFTEEHEKNIDKEVSGLATSSLFIKEDISRK